MFNFFGLKKKPVIEDVEVKVPTPAATSVAMTFDEALAAQAATEAKQAVEGHVHIQTATDQIGQEKAAALVAEEDAKAKAEEVEKAEQEAAALAAAQKAAPPPPEPVAVPQAKKAPEVLGQMDTITATREDVIAAYKIFLGRLPESMEVVDARVGVSPAALLVDFLASKEFLDQAPKSQLVLAVAKKILDERKQAVAAEGTSPSEQGQPAA